MLETKDKLNGTELESGFNTGTDDESRGPIYRDKTQEGSTEMSVEDILAEFREKKEVPDDSDSDEIVSKGKPEVLTPEELTAQLRAVQAEMQELRALLDDKPRIRGEPGDIKKKSKKDKVLSVISNVLFYVIIVGIVLGAFLMRSTSKGKPFMLAGYSAANVLTSSMEDVYPKGSLIITKTVDPNELQIGDDITFMVNENSSITHRIIGIMENYQDTGQRAFQTKGTMNTTPDKEPVAATNVVGKVVFHSKAIGDIANFIKANWPILIFVLLVIIGLISFLKWNSKRSDDDEEPITKKEIPTSHSAKRRNKVKRSTANNGK